MAQSLENRLVVAISSRALFDLEESHRLFTSQGLEAYSRYQVEHEDVVLEKGVAYGLVQKLLQLNQGATQKRVEVILLSHNSADTGLRVFNSIQKHGLDISLAAFTNGASPWRYIEPFNADLFLSAEAADVVKALDNGYAAAAIVPSRANTREDRELRIAFDGDAVLFSDEAEQVYQEQGLEAFAESEQARARQPLSGGPFKNFLAALHRIQSEYPPDQTPIRTALVTARSAPAHERVIRTLRSWNIRIDEALFLGGLPKGEFLKTFGADIFFDDQKGHVEAAATYVATGHVPHGVSNRGGR
jgi:5'-nucleotidase